MDQLRELPSKDTSASLQHKCALMYLIAHIDQPTTLEEMTLPYLLDIGFDCKFQIQEKYYGCLYLNLLR